MIQNLTGDLQIGSLNYSIFAGDGKTDTLGNFMMLGESSSGELVLEGIVQHNSTVTTDATLSRLSSLAYLALSGSMMLTNLGSGSVVSGELNQNVTSTLENMRSVNPTANSTSLTQFEFSSSVANFTTQTQTTENATLSTSNSTSFGQAAPSATLPQQNYTTMTATQLNNHTITVYVSNAVANSTITQTTTTTVADTTVTQVISITVSNTTVIVTNSTSSGH